VRADIALNFAIQMMRLEKKEEAAEYLNIARKALEPLPGAEWGERFEWHKMRKELYENITIFYRQQQEWQKAFDNLRLTIGHQKRLGENTSETNLNCAIFLANMNRYAESIEYAQESCNEIEKFLGIVHNRPLQEYKYNGKNRDIMEEKDKQFTTYAMANHAVAKALMNLQYFKEARYFLNKASTAVNKCLNVPKRDLSIAVGNDMSKLTQVSRGTLKNMTEQQVKGSLITIKTDLATRAMSGYGGDRIEQRAVMR
jgi:tetratricopeptide (TPR) repeat protein